LLQQAVDERGFAVVDVGDDGNVAKIHVAKIHESRRPERRGWR
jgi:hypothetical protein